MPTANQYYPFISLISNERFSSASGTACAQIPLYNLWVYYSDLYSNMACTVSS